MRVSRRGELLGPVIGFAALLGASLLILLAVSWLEGGRFSWNPASLSSFAEVVAGVLAIAITVVAIVVELASNRYTHRISQLFVRHPVNIAVMSVFVLTTVVCVWVAAMSREPSEAAAAGGPLSQAGMMVSMLLVTFCLLALLPYFGFVFGFLSPVNVIARIRSHALRAIRRSRARRGVGLRAVAIESIEEIEDIARGAMEHSDRSIAMAAVDALVALLEDYAALRDSLPEHWFVIDGSVARDPDFVSMAPVALGEIEAQRLWLEVKILRQYLALFTESLNRARDVCSLIALNSCRVATKALEGHPELLELCTRFFNSYLRAAINAADLRTSYYVLDQYRQVAETALASDRADAAIGVAEHFRFYAQLGFERNQSFLLEAVAYDLSQLIEVAVEEHSPAADPLLELLLGVDREDEGAEQELRLLAVRRAQVQLATFFLHRDDQARARRIFEDMKGEKRARLAAIREQLLGERRPEYWEFTDRGVNFAYLPPERRELLGEFFGWFD